MVRYYKRYWAYR